jgi:predicted unusual protein kinase regulating ubiquinone biosynthesis (AarF/ABC1/UbiB family)
MLTRLALDPTLAASCRLLSQGMLRQGRSLTTKSSLRTRTSSHASRSNFSSVWAAPVVGCYAVGVNLTTQCQAEGHKLVMYPTRRRFQRPVVVRPPSWWDTVQRYWRMWMRLWKLAFHLAPVVAFYPILLAKARQEKPEHADAHEYVLLSQDQKDAARHADWWLGWYLKLCLSCVESSGAAVIKLMQWAGSRPDLFGHDFCAVFSQLQDATTPHPWSHTEQALAQAYGSEWRERMQVGELLGSGCIGQVYKGNVKATPESDWNEVAVKVLHPNVRADIDADLDLMRVVARMSKWVPLLHTLKWLDVEGVVEEFADLLQLQLDLRHEAENLKRFGENFRKDPSVVFPEVVEGFVPTRHVLVESFCDGIPVLQFAREHQDQPEKLSQMCMTAIRAICQMIFLDNFMHGR